MKEQDLLHVYQENFPLWGEALRDVVNSISALLEAEEIRFSVKKRIKSLESLNAKKQAIISEEKNNGSKIKDLLGVRFVVPFLEDVERIVDIVSESFKVIEIERKSEDLSYREFAYDSVHMEIPLENLKLIFPNFCGDSCEIQIRTILQDAWAEIEHEIVYKSNIEFPDNKAIRKKLAAVNANLSLSDMIFQEIREKRKELETWGHERFNVLQKRAKKVSVESLPKFKGINNTRSIESQENEPIKDVENTLFKALLAHNDKNYRRAIDLYSEALNTNPPLKIRAIIYNHRGLAFFMLNKERYALKDFEDSFKCDPTHQVLKNRGLVLRRMGLTNEAIYNFNESLAIQPHQPDVYYLKAQTHYETQDYVSAKNDVETALHLNPEHIEAQELLQKL